MVNLPYAAVANADSAEAIAAATAAAQVAFIASATVLINNAIQTALFQIEPILPLIITPSYVMTYFGALGYTVQFPICSGCNCEGDSGYPYEPCFVAGFPEVLPPGYVPWNCSCGYSGPSRIKISWAS